MEGLTRRPALMSWGASCGPSPKGDEHDTGTREGVRRRRRPHADGCPCAEADADWQPARRAVDGPAAEDCEAAAVGDWPCGVVSGEVGPAPPREGEADPRRRRYPLRFRAGPPRHPMGPSLSIAGRDPGLYAAGDEPDHRAPGRHRARPRRALLPSAGALPRGHA